MVELLKLRAGKSSHFETVIHRRELELKVTERHPLIEVATHVRDTARSARVAVIFDLDSTLFCVSPRTQSILRDLGHDSDFSARFQFESEILRNIEVLPTDWGVSQVLERTKVEATPSRSPTATAQST